MPSRDDLVRKSPVMLGERRKQTGPRDGLGREGKERALVYCLNSRLPGLSVGLWWRSQTFRGPAGSAPYHSGNRGARMLGAGAQHGGCAGLRPPSAFSRLCNAKGHMREQCRSKGRGHTVSCGKQKSEDRRPGLGPSVTSVGLSSTAATSPGEKMLALWRGAGLSSPLWEMLLCASRLLTPALQQPKLSIHSSSVL